MICDVPYQVKRMVVEACLYEKGARILATHIFEDTGNSGNMLHLTALEIVLKGLYLLEKKELCKGGHSFKKIFDKLRGKTQNKILKYAKEMTVDYRAKDSDVFCFGKALEHFRTNFVDARYSYEKNIFLTEQELNKKTQNWIKQEDSENLEPDFIFYPKEREILFRAVKKVINDRLNTSF